jgi:Fe(3+) dicitrate transport protein
MRFFFLILTILLLNLTSLNAENALSTIRDTTLFLSLNDTLKYDHLESVTIVGDRAKSLAGSGQYIGIRKLTILNQPNINNILRTIPGVNIRDEEGFGLRPNIGLRGTPVNRSAKVTIMEDGILIAPAPYADPSAYYFPTFARMQGVEVLKGSSQIKYGPYTIGGAVNLLSTAIPSSFKGFAQLSYGSFGNNQQRIWVGDSHKNFDYVFEVSRLASIGFKQLDSAGNTGFDRRDMMGKLRWHTSENATVAQSVTLKFVNSTEIGNESYLGLTYEDFISNPLRRYAATQKDVLDMDHQHLSINHQINPIKNFNINTTAYYSSTYRDWARVNAIGGQSLNNILSNPTTYQTAYQIMVGRSDGNIDFQSAARTYYSKGVQSNGQYIYSSGDITHKVLIGVRYHIDQADRYATRSIFEMKNGTMILNTAGIIGNQENQIRNANSISSYLNYDFSYKGLKVSPGIRYESIQFEIQNFGNLDNGRLGTALKSATNDLNIFLPGIGFNYKFNDLMNVFAGVHKGFSPPGMPSTTAMSGQARSETAINYELGYRYHSGGLNIQLVGFLNDFNNILGSDNVSGGGAGSGEVFNAGNANINGVEFSFEYDLMHLFNKNTTIRTPLNIAYTYTSATFQETFINAGGDWGSGKINKGDAIPFITPHLLTSSIALEYKNFSAIIMSRYVGTTRTKPGQESTLTPDKGIKYTDVNAIAGFLILDLSTNYRISEHFTFFTTVNNMTNNRSIVANLPNGYRPNMPLSLNVGMKIDF